MTWLSSFGSLVRWLVISSNSFSDLAKHQRAISPAKAEVVVHRDIDLHVTRNIRAVIQIALGILLEDIDGRRRDLVVYRQCAIYRLHPARAAQQMAGHRLGGIHHQLA